MSDLSLAIARGDTVGVVGESGSGKSALLRAIAGLHPPRAGTIRFQGQELAPAAQARSADMRRDIQLVFQNPDSSLNPRQSVGEILNRPIRLFRNDVARGAETHAVTSALDEVGLAASTAQRYPGELSGGQRQRVAIARAFAARPALLLCDEVTSALDVSVQATVLELIAGLAATFATTVVFVSHGVRQPRPRRRAHDLPACGGDARRTDLRGRTDRRGLRGTTPPLHPGTPRAPPPRRTLNPRPESKSRADVGSEAAAPPSGTRRFGPCPHTEPSSTWNSTGTGHQITSSTV